MSSRETKEVFMQGKEPQLGPERWKRVEFEAIIPATRIEMSQNVKFATGLCNTEWKSG